MASTSEPTPDLARCEPLYYHDVTRRGYVAIFHPRWSGRNQQSFWLDELPSVIEQFAGANDIYISQGEFTKPNRRTVNLARMPVAFADLDTYKQEALRDRAPEVQLALLLQACDARGIPEPSLVVHSGRGLQVKWVFRAPVPQGALPRWGLVQSILTERLSDFGADMQARDASRVLRLEGSMSSRSGTAIRTLYRASNPSMGGQLLPTGVVGYDFEEFADTVFPLARRELTAQRDKRRQKPSSASATGLINAQAAAVETNPASRSRRGTFATAHPLIPQQLAWDRLHDLRTLVRLRGHEDGLPPGGRNEFVFLAAVFLAQSCVSTSLWQEVETLAREFSPSWSASEVRSCTSSVIQRAQAAARGETTSFNGVDHDPRYRYKNKTLVEMLGITSSEAAHLKTLLPDDERRRRNTHRHMQDRRKEGAVPREAYLNRAQGRREEARRLHAEGKSRREIAELLGVTKQAVIGYLKG